MMKTLILSSLLLCCALPAVAQHDIYALNARGEVIADSAFIDPFVWINPTVEYEPLYSRTLFTPGLSGSYAVKLYRYKNSENDGDRLRLEASVEDDSDWRLGQVRPGLLSDERLLQVGQAGRFDVCSFVRRFQLRERARIADDRYLARRSGDTCLQ